jgi:hypothetical protein
MRRRAVSYSSSSSKFRFRIEDKDHALLVNRFV